MSNPKWQNPKLPNPKLPRQQPEPGWNPKLPPPPEAGEPNTRDRATYRGRDLTSTEPTEAPGDEQ